jgi:hypothetical protein
MRAFCWGCLGERSSAIEDCDNGLIHLKHLKRLNCYSSCPPGADITLLPRHILQANLVTSTATRRMTGPTRSTCWWQQDDRTNIRRAFEIFSVKAYSWLKMTNVSRALVIDYFE